MCPRRSLISRRRSPLPPVALAAVDVNERALFYIPGVSSLTAGASALELDIPVRQTGIGSNSTDDKMGICLTPSAEVDEKRSDYK